MAAAAVPPAHIELNGIGVRFRLHFEKAHTLKEVVVNLLHGKTDFRDFWAVQDVTLAVPPGEAVALIGRNGSGKSTLLKVIAGVYPATVGTCAVRGKVAPLIELGAGFNGELTGRENVFLNGAILGRSRAEMTERYQRIVEFAELEAFMDVPVKNYSSGMYARLGFAIAMDVEADILLIDEILGVGDEAFQAKCHRRIEEHLAAGRTLVFVSHSADQVLRYCRRALVLKEGKVAFIGDAQEAVQLYRADTGLDSEPRLAAPGA